ncbi:hypothetical protein H312_02648 [Anncaliia algerae PRA339]|uniref:Uncharacterized protein n=1 Tax=Anncaliia algerae PRA339 TaxID=1288291 RepID=A0A059EYY3_9MICR|nr:hypothetical protein H312_02648 [Anncaliia algerae PRA339]
MLKTVNVFLHILSSICCNIDQDTNPLLNSLNSFNLENCSAFIKEVVLIYNKELKDNLRENYLSFVDEEINDICTEVSHINKTYFEEECIEGASEKTNSLDSENKLGDNEILLKKRYVSKEIYLDMFLRVIHERKNKEHNHFIQDLFSFDKENINHYLQTEMYLAMLKRKEKFEKFDIRKTNIAQRGLFQSFKDKLKQFYQGFYNIICCGSRNVENSGNYSRVYFENEENGNFYTKFNETHVYPESFYKLYYPDSCSCGHNNEPEMIDNNIFMKELKEDIYDNFNGEYFATEPVDEIDDLK